MEKGAENLVGIIPHKNFYKKYSRNAPACSGIFVFGFP